MNEQVGAARDCHYCERKIAEGREVELWDGHVYCEACVESVCPGLSKYTRSHSCLEEVVPTDPPTAVCRSLVICALLFALSLLSPHEECLQMFGWAGYVVMSVVLVALLFYLPLSLGAAMPVRCSLSAASLIVHFGRGPIRLRGGWKGKNAYSSKWSAVKCWCESTAIGHLHSQWPIVVLAVPNVRRKVIILEVPQPRILGLEAPCRHCACGWTPEMHHRWRALLVLGRVPQGRTSDSALEEEESRIS